MGKYDAVISKLERLPAEYREGGAAYQERINQAKTAEAFPDRTATGLMIKYAECRKKVDDLEDQLSAANLMVEAAAQLLVEVYEGEGLQSQRIGGVGTVRVEYKPHASVTNKEEFHAWCLENGFGPQMHLMWQTTNSIAKEKILNAEEPPPGVKVFNKPTPVLTREK